MMATRKTPAKAPAKAKETTLKSTEPKTTKKAAAPSVTKRTAPSPKKTPAKKATSKAPTPVEVSQGSFVKVTADGKNVLSDTLYAGEKKLNETTSRYLANKPTEE